MRENSADSARILGDSYKRGAPPICTPPYHILGFFAPQRPVLREQHENRIYLGSLVQRREPYCFFNPFAGAAPIENSADSARILGDSYKRGAPPVCTPPFHIVDFFAPQHPVLRAQHENRIHLGSPVQRRKPYCFFNPFAGTAMRENSADSARILGDSYKRGAPPACTSPYHILVFFAPQRPVLRAQHENRIHLGSPVQRTVALPTCSLLGGVVQHRHTASPVR